MTTGEENLGFDSPLKVGMQNIKRSKEKKKKNNRRKTKTPSPKAFLFFFPLSCKPLDHPAVLPLLVAGSLVGWAEQNSTLRAPQDAQKSERNTKLHHLAATALQNAAGLGKKGKATKSR